MTPRQRELARHARGLPNSSGRRNRNHYVSYFRVSVREWGRMVAAGEAKRGPNRGGAVGFTMTRKGAEAALEPGETLCPEDFPDLRPPEDTDMVKVPWQLIETAPKGVERNGKRGVTWLMLAYPDDDGEMNVANGMRVGDRFYVAATFYCGGPFDGKQYKLSEYEVQPTHWAPLPAPPAGGLPARTERPGWIAWGNETERVAA
ncbi:MAG: hypothetical protein AAGI03_06820 [Pseudomonadota bacterium]